MTDRYCHQDIDFFHKKTCATLMAKLGPFGVLAFLSLCTEAKRSRIPGVVIVASEPDFWKQLGLYGEPLDFTMDEFLKATGRIKQTSRRRVGRLSHVVLTNYGRWQNDYRRENERERKSRKRQEYGTDNGRTSSGRQSGQKADREGDRERTPLTPHRGNGMSSTYCRLCPGGLELRTAIRFADHQANVHGIGEPVAAPPEPKEAT